MKIVGLVLVAFLARMGMMVVLGLPPALEPDPEWSWAYEQGAVAQSILRGDGYSDAFASATGPTAWAGPTHPLFLAGAIYLAEGINRDAQILVALLEALISALIILPLLSLGQGLGRPRLGLVAAILWALHPLASYRCVSSPWDAPLVGLLLISFLASLAHAGRGAGPRALIKPGVLLGLAALVNPAAMALVPAAVGFLIPGRTLGSMAGALGALLGAALLVLSPWMIRNALVLGSPALKMNLGVEMLVGNNGDVDGNFNPQLHPSVSATELRLYREMGERAYGAECMDRAQEWIVSHPRRFVALCVRRVQLYWLGPSPFEPVRLSRGATQVRDWKGWVKWAMHCGMGLLALLGACIYRDKRGGTWLIGGTLVLYPIVYYVTHVIERYRSPLEPLLTFAVAALILSLIDRGLAARNSD